MPMDPATQINEETILKRYESLPDDLKDALMGISTADAIYEIGKKANLNIEKIGMLAQEVGLIILGFVPSSNFISDIKTELGITEENASLVAGEVNDRVFLPIRESLKRLHGAAWAEGLTKPPMKFEGEKLAEKKPGMPMREISPAPAATTVVPKPEIRMPPPQAPTQKEPLIIRPMGTPSAAAPKEEMTKEMPRPAPRVMPPSAPSQPQPIQKIPQPSAPERKPFEMRPSAPLAPARQDAQKLSPIAAPPASFPYRPPANIPSAFGIKPPETKPSPQEIKTGAMPAQKPPETFTKIPSPPPSLPVTEQKPSSFVAPSSIPAPQKLFQNQTVNPPILSPKPAIPEPRRSGSDQYREPIE